MFGTFCNRDNELNKYMYFFFSFFSTGLVWLYIAGLPLRSCRTIGAPSVQGSAQCPFFSFLAAAGFETHVLVLTMQTSYRCATFIIV